MEPRLSARALRGAVTSDGARPSPLRDAAFGRTIALGEARAAHYGRVPEHVRH